MSYNVTNRDFFDDIFGVLRKFGFLTGVTKFSHVSVFSDLNNLNDISMDASCADLCGISEKELHANFEESIHELATANNMTYKETCDKLQKRYDGYHFRQDSVGIYNPFSLLNTFQKKEFKDYWFETGTPTFLVRLLQENDYDLSGLQGKEITTYNLSTVDMMRRNPIPVIYQSGYLTIKGYDEEFGMYSLDFPN